MANIPNARQYRHYQRRAQNSAVNTRHSTDQPSGSSKESAVKFAIVGTLGAIVLAVSQMHWLAMISATIAGIGLGQIFQHNASVE